MNRPPGSQRWSFALIAFSSLAVFVFSGCPSYRNTTENRGDSSTTTGPGNTSTSKGPERPVKRLKATPIAEGLDNPVKMAVAPDGTIFFTELLSGNVRVIENGKVRAAPIKSFKVVTEGETGLLGIAVDPDFQEDPFIYVYLTQEIGGQIENRVVRFRYENGGAGETEVLLGGIPAARIHNGGEINFGPDKRLYIGTGDATNQPSAQSRRALSGKVLRIDRDGGIPDDNPFEGSPVYSIGHRNVFGLAFHPGNDDLYITENGPDRNDEINRIKRGANYGWPEAIGPSNDDRFVDPLQTFTPNIAPTGATFVRGTEIYGSGYENNLIFGDYLKGTLHRLELSKDGSRIIRDSALLSEDSIFDVAQSPKGQIYFVSSGKISRLDPIFEE